MSHLSLLPAHIRFLHCDWPHSIIVNFIFSPSLFDRAITVHKSQGTTLTRAQLMIQNTFDSGQAYVALSRVTGFEGLWLTKPITRNSIRADRDALDFYGYSTFAD